VDGLPTTRYAKNGDVHLAYQVVGEGSLDLVLIESWVHHVEALQIGGLAVHIGARVAATGGGGDIVVSSTVKDLVAGSGLTFADRGEHELKGVPGSWRLFAVDG
jgi:class 3 adenylate cyclase